MQRAVGVGKGAGDENLARHDCGVQVGPGSINVLILDP
jgi:hypothetical protein